MFKKISYLIAMICLIIGGLVLLTIAPYHFYTIALTEGVSTSFLEIKKSSPSFYNGESFYFPKPDKEQSLDGDQFYTIFHFSNFEIPLPFNHPLFSFIPTIKIENTGPRLGGSFLDGKNSDLFSFIIERPQLFEASSSQQKIFTLPIFKNYIAKKNEIELWKDVFSKKLALPSHDGLSFYQSLLSLHSVSYEELVYNLYILFIRNQLFPKDTIRISFDDYSKHGLIEFRGTEEGYRHEKIFILENTMMYTMVFKTKIGQKNSERIREKLVKEITFKNSTIDSAIPIYAQYKNISYGRRIDQQGMTYLYAAWSHDTSNREYIRVIISFLERGKSNLKFLKPFYEYAYRRFGSSLSSDNGALVETAEEKLKRKVQEDLESELKTEEHKKTIKDEGSFSTSEEKIKYFLNKAKENKINSDDSSKVLIQE